MGSSRKVAEEWFAAIRVGTPIRVRVLETVAVA